MNNDVSLIDLSYDGDRTPLIKKYDYIYELAKSFFSENKDFGYKTDDPYYHDCLFNLIKSHISVLPFSYYVSNGTYELFRSLLKCFKSGNVLGLKYQFQPFIDILTQEGYKFLPIENSSFSFPQKEIIERIKSDDISCIIIERPMNFSGLTANFEELKPILQISNLKNIPIIFDESYANYIPFKESTLHLLSEFKNIIVLRSNSKGFNLGGFRTGIIFFGSLQLAEQFKLHHRPYTPDLFSIQLFASQLMSKDHPLYKLQERIYQNKLKIKKCLSKKGYKYLSSHPNIPILILYHPDFDVIEKFKTFNVKISNYANKPIFQEERLCCRIRIPTDIYIVERFCKIL